MTDESNGEVVRSRISKALDDGKDLNDYKTKEKLLDEIQADYPHFKRGTTNASISKFRKTEQEKRGLTTNKVPKGKFDPSLSVKTRDGSVPTIKNPLKNGSTAETKPNTPADIFPISTCEGITGTMYAGFKMGDLDMADLTPQERKDIAATIKPLLDRYVSGERGFALLSCIAIFGIFLRKKQDARNIRKERKEKSLEPNEETKTEFPKKSDDVIHD